MTEVVAALVWREDRFLICQRPMHKTQAGLWEFVGGKVEPGESKTDALIRECREEMNMTVKPFGVFTEVIHTYPDITVHLTLMECTITEGEPELLEHMALRWITPAEIPEYDFSPADAEILRRITEKTLQ